MEDLGSWLKGAVIVVMGVSTLAVAYEEQSRGVKLFAFALIALGLLLLI